MCAIGSQDTTRPSLGKAITSSNPCTADITLEWISCTPLGGPVVPEV
jgi:hypothetical protein